MANAFNCRFHHVVMYVSQIRPMEEYKKMEENLNSLANKGSFDPFSGGMRFLDHHALPERVREGRQAWESIVSDAKDPEKFLPAGQDVVEQLIVGAGCRVTAEYVGPSVRAVLVCSNDPCGQKCVVVTKTSDKHEDEPYFHFNSKSIDTFRDSHVGRDGIAVLGFEVDPGTLDQVLKNYQEKHPELLVSKTINEYKDYRKVVQGGQEKTLEFGAFRSIDVYAYYLPDEKKADKGTVIRLSERTGMFAHRAGFGNPQGVLPGLDDVPAVFDGTSVAAYSDHWVSNVVNRKSFLTTLEDTLGFTPKVDFNAGVVAAGEAIIESTVTGNTSGLNSTDMDVVFQDQSQVYLPINNALSEVGHVHGFINEMGQGVQHLALRVKDLTMFIERVNNYRKITGQGFTFLRIPRSYYGRFTVQHFVKEGVSEGLAEEVSRALVNSNLMSNTGVVNLEITREDVKGLKISDEKRKEFDEKLETISMLVLRARYSNMYSLLREHVTEAQYLQIVQNQILVDIQGQDILYQIFTSNILQKNAGEEAPFFEFIQRVCSVCAGADGKPLKIRPGCGGFGIRNFLTLFLSIEVSKAMLEYDNANASGNKPVAERAQKVVDALTAQLEESNPILTGISDAMTAEADELDFAENAEGEKKQQHLANAEKYRKVKEEGNEKLKVTSDRYKNLLKEIRES